MWGATQNQSYYHRPCTTFVIKHWIFEFSMYFLQSSFSNLCTPNCGFHGEFKPTSESRVWSKDLPIVRSLVTPTISTVWMQRHKRRRCLISTGGPKSMERRLCTGLGRHPDWPYLTWMWLRKCLWIRMGLLQRPRPVGLWSFWLEKDLPDSMGKNGPSIGGLQIRLSLWSVWRFKNKTFFIFKY